MAGRAVVSVFRWLPLVLIAACGILSSDDGAAAVVWVEARVSPAGLEIRAIGSTGCAGLKSVRAVSQNVDGWATVELRARAHATDAECFAPVTFDTTFSIEVPTAEHVRLFSPFGPFGKARELVILDVPRARAELFAGGQGIVVEDGESCVLVRPLPGPIRGPTYALAPTDRIAPRDGDLISVSGIVRSPAAGDCSDQPILEPDRIEIRLRQVRDTP